MAGLLKDMYSIDFIRECGNSFHKIYPNFKIETFTKKVFTNDWKNKELKDRTHHIAKVLRELLPSNFEETAIISQKLIKTLIEENDGKEGRVSFPYMFIPDYIETYGLNNYETSIKCMELVTQFISCEFAVRPFIVKYESKMVKQMQAWTKHKNEHVRRLASEGIRPRLPWAMALTEFKKDPAPILPILENLKTDPSEYVRRSVANNLNDISKDNPELVLKIIENWKGTSKETDWIIKHGCRTLLKQGHNSILEHYGLDNKNIELEGFIIEKAKVPMGGTLSFAFTVLNKNKNSKTIRLEYAVYFKRLGDKFGKKVFKISEKEYATNHQVHIAKKHSFKTITTRKYYAGEQMLSIIVNGKENKPVSFLLENH